jgi:hypothetical protein
MIAKIGDPGADSATVMQLLSTSGQRRQPLAFPTFRPWRPSPHAAVTPPVARSDRDAQAFLKENRSPASPAGALATPHDRRLPLAPRDREAGE